MSQVRVCHASSASHSGMLTVPTSLPSGASNLISTVPSDFVADALAVKLVAFFEKSTPATFM